MWYYRCYKILFSDSQKKLKWHNFFSFVVYFQAILYFHDVLHKVCNRVWQERKEIWSSVKKECRFSNQKLGLDLGYPSWVMEWVKGIDENDIGNLPVPVWYMFT